MLLTLLISFSVNTADDDAMGAAGVLGGLLSPFRPVDTAVSLSAAQNSSVSAMATAEEEEEEEEEDEADVDTAVGF